ncbi:OmpA family protein [Virgisporangium aliadipatigenens]|nr:OmpA family protein [Virgisporangium aliadipatigenens]
MRGATIVRLLLAASLLLSGCGDDGAPVARSTPGASDPAAPAVEEEATSLPPGAQPGLDDLDGDGKPDPTCSTQDFGAGLTLRIPCEIPNPHEPAEGTTLVKDSLFRLPAYEANLDGISGALVTARDTGGAKVVIMIFNSDNLFATGADTLNESHTLDPLIALLNAKFAGAAVQVRGHTDATGTASANQALSERRAETVRAYLTGHGMQASGVTAVGLGSTRPLVEETNDAGRAFNRRVELAIRLP